MIYGSAPFAMTLNDHNLRLKKLSIRVAKFYSDSMVQAVTFRPQYRTVWKSLQQLLSHVGRRTFNEDGIILGFILFHNVLGHIGVMLRMIQQV